MPSATPTSAGHCRPAFRLASALLLGGVALTLAGCGGGGGDTDFAAARSFNTLDEAAGALAAVNGFVVGDVGEGNATKPDAIAAKQGTTAAGSRSGYRPQITTTDACDGGGSVSFTTNDSTVFTQDGTSLFNQCMEIARNGSGTETGRNSTNGTFDQRCSDSAQTTTSCNRNNFALGTASSPLTSVVRETAAGGQNSSTRSVLAVLDETGSTRTRSTFDGTLEATNLNTSRVAGYGLTGFVVVEDVSSGNSTLVLDGGVQLSGTRSRCFVGSLVVRTQTPIVASGSSGRTISGRASATVPGSNAGADYVFNADGSVAVTVSGLGTRTYTAAELAQFCL